MKLIKLICILMLAISIMHCTKSEEKGTLHYNQTQCADLWDTSQGDTDEEVIASVNTFFETKYQIVLENVSVNNDGTGESCRGCSCLGGRVIIVTEAELFHDELIAEGFFIP